MARSDRRHLVTLQGPGGPPVPDGDGGWTVTPVPLDPPDWCCSITPAAVRDLERVSAGTVLTTATHVFEGDFHPGLTLQAVILFEGRTFYVNGLVDPGEQHITTIALCQEVKA